MTEDIGIIRLCELCYWRGHCKDEHYDTTEGCENLITKEEIEEY